MIQERARRLLVPLIFGVLVVVPPMVYLEKRFEGSIEPGFPAFYRDLFNTGVYPAGHLSWHHYWFIAYLFLFVLCPDRCLRHCRPARSEAVTADGTGGFRGL